jgi:hypothetical protein
MSPDDARLIAFYLPHFHPIPENDEWWGKGFTEWTNVVQARPLFPGHYQPHLPSDLGFYDLRLPEVRQAQADLAREYGIHGFCYYHYWFNGRRLLERPFEEVLASGKPDLPFCLCWANENWTRRWDGRDKEVLLEQHYCEQDDREHLRSLAAAFRDPRYIRVGGRPLFLVYRASALPNPVRTTAVWREEARALGVGELYLCRVESFADDRDDPRQSGFDAGVEFQPDAVNLSSPVFQRSHKVYDYPATVERMRKRSPPAYPRIPCVTPSWDNSARRKWGAVIFRDSSPELYEEWLTDVLQQVRPIGHDERIVFINAWNEWAEGNHLEPCQRWGRAYLEATRSALVRARRGGPLLASPAESPSVQERAQDVLVRIDAEIKAASDQMEYLSSLLDYYQRVRATLDDLSNLIPQGTPFVLVDQDEFRTYLDDDRPATPFLEKEGQYWGPPADDETAIREMERLRQFGAEFMVFLWPAFWWLDHYAGLHQHLRSRYRCILENHRLIMFSLQGGDPPVRRTAVSQRSSVENRVALAE